MRISFLFLFFAILAISCKKDHEHVTPPPQDSFSAYVNGIAFVPTSVDVRSGFDPNIGVRSAGIGGIDVNGYQIYFVLYEYDGTKLTFNLDPSSSSFADYGIPNPYSTSTSNSGEIKINSFDKTTYAPGEVITGVFWFETDDSIGKYSITDGRFSVFVPPY